VIVLKRHVSRQSDQKINYVILVLTSVKAGENKLRFVWTLFDFNSYEDLTLAVPLN